MSLEQKTPILKSISGETETGGAPFYGDDLVRIQENNKKDLINGLEFFRSRLPDFLYFPSVVLHDKGIILAGLEYDATDINNIVVNEGYILSGGEICYYPGGTIPNPNVGSPYGSNLRLYLYKGPATYTTRVFNDGFSKQILVTHSVVAEVSGTGQNGPVVPAGVQASDQVVVLVAGNSGSTTTESYHTIDGAMGLNSLKGASAKSSFIGATNLRTGVALTTQGLPYICSRARGHLTEVFGAVEIDFSTHTGSALFDLSDYNLGQTPGVGMPLLVQSNTASLTDVSIKVFAGFDGVVSIDKSVANFPTSGTAVLFFNAVVCGRGTQPTDVFESNNDFLNITP